MTTGLPSGSVTGKRGWEWNRWQAEVRSRAGPADMSPQGSSGPLANQPSPRRPDRSSVRPPDVATLEAKLGRAERRHHHVIAQYERLLDERNRELADRQGSPRDDDALPGVISTVRRWIAGR